MKTKKLKPLISILMAAYNSEKTIRHAIDSVLAQTFSDWELLIVDDCSSDNTLRIAEAYRDARIHVMKNDRNRGVSLTRKKGLDAAEGDWIAVLDSDDMWAPEKLEKQLAIAKADGADLVFTGSAFIRDDGTPFHWQLHVPATLTYCALLKQNLVSNSSVLVRADVYRKFYIVDDTIHEDYAMWLAISKAGAVIRGLDEPLLFYRLLRPSRSSNKLKAARMRWRTYRHAGLNTPTAAYYMCWYAAKGILKYGHLLR